MEIFDLIIIGGGPAGAAAGVYAGRKHIKTLIITESFRGQSAVSFEIQNWIGTIKISGEELSQNLKKHVLAYAGNFVELKEGFLVTEIKKENNYFLVIIQNGDIYKAKTILIATGAKRKKLDVPGADKYEHKGLTYCATCDGPLFVDKNVAVIGGGDSAFEATSQLLTYAKSVTLIHRRDTFKAEEVIVKKIITHPKFKTILNAEILALEGDNFLRKVIYLDKISNEKKEIEIDGVFVEIGQVPNSNLAKDIVELDENGHIKIDPWTQKTSTLGIWAAGDVTNVLYHQNNIACGDAIKALEDIHNYLHRHN